jgi:heme exporter protein D
MNWSSWADFAAMGGYALYVWGAFGVCAAAMLAEVALIAGRRRELVSRDGGAFENDLGD